MFLNFIMVSAKKYLLGFKLGIYVSLSISVFNSPHSQESDGILHFFSISLYSLHIFLPHYKNRHSKIMKMMEVKPIFEFPHWLGGKKVGWLTENIEHCKGIHEAP